jgi:hypothetical protein
MGKYPRWLIAAGIAVVVVIAAIVGYFYSVSFAKGVTQTQAHTAAGAATACGTAVPTTGLRSFQVVPAQTTASYSVHENLNLCSESTLRI